MYLKSIDIFGYKSFAAKTHVDLGPGITGIIGPNGCGKSNIMEAVRWCLGEMSWKSLRAGSMVDVIFAGTGRRSAMSMAEVTLTFDNQSSLLPVQFSEVTVTRRIFRSGESAYFLNKTQCRLKDIRELFLDTGVGNDGYAIIDQGGVDAMITAKPEERRAFFEEAAGVAKYNAKREEALRKLERVELDMGRLQDSLALINEQVKKLDSDARKAKLFQKYKEELAAMEAAHLLQQLGEIEAELAAVAAESAPLEEALGARKVELDGESALVAAHNLEKANQQNQIIDCNRRLSEVKSEMGRLEERVESAQAAIAEGDARAAACEAETALTRQRVEAIGPELQRAAAEVEQAEAARAAAQAEADGWDGQLRLLEEKLADAEAALESVRAAARQAAEEALGARRRLSEAESLWARQETQARGSLRELEKDLAQVAQAEGELAGARERLVAQEQLAAQAQEAAAAAESALADERRRQSELSESTVTLHSELAQTRAKVEALEAQGGQNPYWVGAQAVLQAGLPGVVGTVRQLISVDDSQRQALEDLLGERLYAVVCEHAAAAREAIDLLAASGKGRARFLVLSALPGELAERTYPEEARPLVKQVRCEPQHERAVRFLLAEAYQLGKALYGEHWVYGGAAEREAAPLGLADIPELRERAGALEARRVELAEAKAACEAAIAVREDESRRAAAALAEASGRAHSLRGQVAEKESSLELHARQAELSREESARLLAEMSLTQEQVLALRAAITGAEQAERDARAREEAAAASLQVLKEELARGRATGEMLGAKVQGAADKCAFLSAGYERLEAERRSLEEAIERRQAELSELARKKEESAATAEQSRQALAELSAKLGELENEAKAGFERLQDLEKTISEKDAAIRALKEFCDATQQQLHGLELRAGERRATGDVLRRRLWDDWQLTYEEARAKYAEQQVDPEKLEFLRRRIVALGNVNMAAPEEYDQLAEKQKFLTTQLEDLTKAKEDLRAAITKINSATRENFRQTFTEVREHFRRLYGVLFEGGEADLLLTDPENILETGVEIVAQPPGKKLQSISLLSGGEKTLTAIALLFAFFMVKPSPFCMLDEADAALDDANIDRFVNLLKDFQSRTQFLIVSHNKRTMEAADAIYGVTMEELGVSQLVSVEFRKRAAAPAETREAPATHGPFELSGEAAA